MLDTKWDKIDVAALARLLSDAGEELSRMREANSTLLGLEKEHGTLSEEHDQANRIRVRTEEEIFHLEQRHGPLVDRQDRVSDSIEEAKETVMLSDDQQIHLDEAFAEHGIVDDLTRLADSFNKVKRHLAERSKEANGSENAAIDSLERVFAAYQRMWFDADLGSSVESYTDYRTVLDALVAEGLPERRAAFKREMALWTGRDLVTLAHSVRESVSHIEDRLRAVNDILDKIPFGREHDRLRIKLRRLTNPKVRDFIQRLNRIAAGATARYADEETDARFEEISSFINLVRPSDSLPKGAAYTRDTLLDVHRHITITAERIDADENQLSVYDSLGGKSGGETQELVAFIVGAALRYQLGDEASSTRPGFAPVLLDEGFIKADAEFAGRAVQAWKRLGFQLIIGAPLDKVSGIETHMDLMLGVNKPRNHSIVSPLSKVATSVVDAS